MFFQLLANGWQPQGWQEILHAESTERHQECICNLLMFLGSRMLVVFSICFSMSLVFPGFKKTSQSGENSRYYHGFRCEDFVGKISDLAGCCHPSRMEETLIQRFYMGLFQNHQFKEDEVSSD